MEHNMGEESKFVHKIEKVEKVATSQVQNDLTGESEHIAVSKTKFDKAVETAQINWERDRPTTKVVALSTEETRPSPIAEMSMNSKKIQRFEPANAVKIIDQVEKLQNDLQKPIALLEDTVKENPALRLSPLYEGSLSEKLVHMDSTLKSALGVVGVEATAVPQAPGAHPLTKFLNYLTSSDKQMSSITGEIQALQASGTKIEPAQLLAVQIKLNFVQQELEFFTNVLNKALESTKTIMNVQV